ncbi:MAG TPA: cobalt-factor II C(20)-methyltransferase [Methanoculleus sp.]|nr:cobalt-factor II C(20)-methyltransferase [Methanoculleus sp.]
MFVAVGLGPGDPELLTVRAVRLLKEADAVFVPGEVARAIVAPYRTDATVLDFPMTDDESRIRRCMEENAETIAPAARRGLAVFGLLGDPHFFGTASRLCAVLHERHPEIAYRTVPGISAITAFASAAGIDVNGGMCVSDGSVVDGRLLLKVTRPREAAAGLRKEGFSEFVLVERMFMEGQMIYRNEDLPEKSPYFSVLFARR